MMKLHQNHSKQEDSADIDKSQAPINGGASQISGNRDKPEGIRGDTPRSPLCFPNFWDAP
jgi:hypothetical protein